VAVCLLATEKRRHHLQYFSTERLRRIGQLGESYLVLLESGN
jgi:hypothetical protein